MYRVANPQNSADNMNYTVVINGALWGGAILYYAFFARKWFKGPKMTLGEVSPSSVLSVTPSQTGLDKSS
jgi:hypothetical protein